MSRIIFAILIFLNCLFLPGHSHPVTSVQPQTYFEVNKCFPGQVVSSEWVVYVNLYVCEFQVRDKEGRYYSNWIEAYLLDKYRIPSSKLRNLLEGNEE